MAEEIVHATDSNFDETVNQGSLVLVDFWADWCHPCKMVAPVVEEIAKEYKGKVVVAKLNVDENSATASRFNIMSIPTLAFFKEGKVVDKLIGAVPKGQIEEKIRALL
jgi:thioredoxin 1